MRGSFVGDPNQSIPDADPVHRNVESRGFLDPALLIDQGELERQPVIVITS